MPRAVRRSVPYAARTLRSRIKYRGWWKLLVRALARICRSSQCSMSRQPSFWTQRSVALRISSWLPCWSLGSRKTRF